MNYAAALSMRGLLRQEISGLRWKNCQQFITPLTRSDSLTGSASHLQMTSRLEVAGAGRRGSSSLKEVIPAKGQNLFVFSRIVFAWLV